jgi:raffinose/stachyose/melibiose transport system substrate-binding protein
MKNKAFLVFALVLIAAFMGCSKKAVESTEGIAGEEKIEITLIHRYLSANVGKYAEDTGCLTRLEDFKRDHPNVTVIEEQLQSDEYNTKAQVLAAANDIPDVLTVPGAWMENFVKNKLLLPLTDYFKAKPALFNGYRPGSFDKCTLNGNIYGYPVAAGPTHVLFYNSKILADNGYPEFPKTWSGFTALCEKLKKAGITPFAFGNKSSSYTQYAWLSSLSDRMTGPDWTHSICDGTGAKFTDKPFVDAVSIIDDFRKKGYFNVDLNSIDGSMMAQYYFDGKAAMYSEGIWGVQNVVSNAPPEVLAVTKVDFFPTPDGGIGNPRSSAGGAGVYYSLNAKIGASGPKFDAVTTMFEYMTAEGAAKIMASAGGFPAYDPKDFDRSGLHRLAIEAYDLCVEAPQTRIFDLWFDASVVEVMNTSLQEMLAGAKPPKEVAQDMQTEYERYLRNR